jgi:hypothetical protein
MINDPSGLAPERIMPRRPTMPQRSTSLRFESNRAREFALKCTHGLTCGSQTQAPKPGPGMAPASRNDPGKRRLPKAAAPSPATPRRGGESCWVGRLHSAREQKGVAGPLPRPTPLCSAQNPEVCAETGEDVSLPSPLVSSTVPHRSILHDHHDHVPSTTFISPI